MKQFLQKYKFVDDEDLATRIVNTNVNLNKYGKNKIKQNLYNKGIDKIIIEQAMDEIDSDKEFIDWQEFIEFGSPDKNSIYLQKTGLSRETKIYLKDHKLVEERMPLIKGKTPIKILPSVFDYKNQSLIEECELLKINMPEIFEE